MRLLRVGRFQVYRWGLDVEGYERERMHSRACLKAMPAHLCNAFNRRSVEGAPVQAG